MAPFKGKTPAILVPVLHTRTTTHHTHGQETATYTATATAVIDGDDDETQSITAHAYCCTVQDPKMLDDFRQPLSARKYKDDFSIPIND